MGAVPPSVRKVIDADADEDAKSINDLFTLLRPHVSELAPLLRPLDPAVAAKYFHPASHHTGELMKPSNVFDVVYTGPVDLYKPLTTLLRALTEHYAGMSTSNKLALRIVREDGVDKVLPSLSQVQEARTTKRITMFNGSQEVGYLGSAVASGDFDADGLPDIVLGAYGRGKQGRSPLAGGLDIHYGCGKTESLEGVGLRSRFGQTLAVLDWNHDSVDDLVVGAPGESGWNLTKSGNKDANLSGFGPWPWEHSRPTFRVWGRVYVLLGQKGRGLPDNLNSGDDVFTLTTKRNFSALGSVLSTGDVNGDGMDDLLLGSPMCEPGDGSPVYVWESLGCPLVLERPLQTVGTILMWTTFQS